MVSVGNECMQTLLSVQQITNGLTNGVVMYIISPTLTLEDFINISNKSTKTSIQIQLYTIAKKKIEKKRKKKTRVAYCKNNNNKSTNRNNIYI